MRDIASLLSSIYPCGLDAKPLRVMSRSERLQRDGEALLARAEIARREAAESKRPAPTGAWS